MENKSLIYVLIVVGILCVGLGLYLVSQKDQPPVQASPVIKSHTVKVSATSPWTSTGIDTTGKTVTIRRVSGMWNSVDDNNDQAGEGLGYYPGTVFPQAKIGELIAKTDTGMHRVAAQTTIESKGLLFLGMNDILGKYGDNHGELVVEVTVK